MKLLLTPILMQLACGDNLGPCTDGSGRHLVEVFLFGEPAVVAYRDGATPWESPSSARYGNYQLCVTDDYVFIAVCANANGSFDTRQHAGTSDDDTELFFGACEGGHR